MKESAKLWLAFLGGACAGAGTLAWINRDRLDFSRMKPCATEMLARGMNMKDEMMGRIYAMKEDFEDMAAEAREKLDAERTAQAADKAREA